MPIFSKENFPNKISEQIPVDLKKELLKIENLITKNQGNPATLEKATEINETYDIKFNEILKIHEKNLSQKNPQKLNVLITPLIKECKKLRTEMEALHSKAEQEHIQNIINSNHPKIEKTVSRDTSDSNTSGSTNTSYRKPSQ